MKQVQDLTQPPDLTQEMRTGPVRVRRPLYLDLMPPCNHACPAGENIQAWLALAQAERFEEAWQVIVQENPMPAVHGRVCYHPCETSCNRDRLDGSVSIHAVERFLGDLALEKGWTPKITAKPSGKKILIVGAGPSGLSCAHHLALLGHEVEIHEAGPLAGGMMHFGIPAYRLPRNILDGEIKRIERLGVKIVLNHKVDDLMMEKGEGGFDAVSVAIGAHVGKHTEIPSRDAGKILDAVSFLKDVELGSAPKLGRRVAIYGGGNTAMDAARVARRLGTEPMIIYRRDRDHMPAHAFEADEALEEGVQIHWLRTIKSIEESTFKVEVMRLDENGRPQPTGEIEEIEADDLILALGQDTDTRFMSKVPGMRLKDDGSVEVTPDMMTSVAGIFAGGDVVPSERTVTIAVGHGKKAARNIDLWLAGKSPTENPTKPIAEYEKLHLWFYTDAMKRPQSHLDLQKRRTTFGEVLSGLTIEEATYEAKRCLSCGNCFGCDGCYGACPEDAIVKLGDGEPASPAAVIDAGWKPKVLERYRYDYDKCTGCGMCFDQCPCHAIEIRPEEAFHE